MSFSLTPYDHSLHINIDNRAPGWLVYRDLIHRISADIDVDTDLVIIMMMIKMVVKMMISKMLQTLKY